MLEPLYTADEMKAAEAGHDIDAMMQRAGAAVAEVAMRRLPDPRGIGPHAGEGAVVRADVTVTMHGRKVGLAVGPGLFHAGDVVVADIGLEPRETEHALVTEEILRRVPRKRAGDNKYTAGSVLVVGGARGMTGAATLAARAAFRADAGYVAIAAPEESLPVLETLVVEAVKRPLDDVFEAA